MGSSRTIQLPGERIPHTKLDSPGGLATLALVATGLLAACGVDATPTPDLNVVGASSDALVNLDYADDEFYEYTARDSTHPIYDPTFVSASEASLPIDEIVVAIEIDGDARAYPASILLSRGLVNDTVGGTPVLVSW